MNKAKLKALVRERGGVRELADKLGWHRNRVQDLLRGNFEPNRAEIVKIAKALRMRQYEFTEIFFPELLDARLRYWDVDYG